MSVNFRELEYYHEEAQKRAILLGIQEKDLEKDKQQLDTICNETHDLRCISFIRSSFFRKMTKESVQALSTLDFIKDMPRSLENHLFPIEELTTNKNGLLEFIEALYSALPRLPAFFADLSNDLLLNKNECILPSIKRGDFLSCSTLPAIFGHCWSREMRRMYMDFLIEIVKNISNHDVEAIRQHWVFECFKTVIHVSDIQQFLKVSMGDILFDLLRNDDLQKKASDKGFSAIAEQLFEVVAQIFVRMNENLEIFPADVRYLIASLSRIGKTPEESLKFAENLFVDCIITPAITNPKAYSVIPPDCFYNQQKSVLIHLAPLFRYIRNKDQAVLRHTNVSFDNLCSLPFDDFLRLLTEDIPEFEPPELQGIINILDRKTVDVLFCVSDIKLLQTLFQGAKLPANLVQAASRFTFTAEGLKFFRCETKHLEAFGIQMKVKPPLFQARESVPETAIIADQIWGFFEGCPAFSTKETYSLTEFLTEYERRASSMEVRVHLDYVLEKLNALPEMEWTSVMMELLRVFDRKDQEIAANTDTQNKMLTHLESMKRVIGICVEKAAELFPVLHSILLELALEQNPEIIQKVKDNREKMLMDTPFCQSQIREIVGDVDKIIGTILKDAIVGVRECVHSWIMTYLTFEDFIKAHPDMEAKDALFTSVPEEIKKPICQEAAPKNIKIMFDQEKIFQFAIDNFKRAEFAKIPIEAARAINRAVNSIQQHYEIAIGGKIAADEMTPLINYTLLLTNSKRLFSLSKYLEHCLVTEHLKHILDFGEYERHGDETLVHFVLHTRSLADAIPDFKCT